MGLKYQNFIKVFNSILKPFKLSSNPNFFRILIIWLISIFILMADSGLKNYDYRFSFRSTQEITDEIVILTLSQAEWDKVFKPSMLKAMIYRQDPVTDSYYWNQFFWVQMMEELQSLGAKKIGVDFYFPKRMSVPWSTYKYFSEKKNVFWSTEVDNLGRLLPSRFSNNFTENIGVNLLRPDYDGILRNFYFTKSNIPQMPEALIDSEVIRLNSENLINFRGPSGTFPTHSLLDVFDRTLKRNIIEGKTVILAPEYGKDHIIKTPIGLMNRAEVYANIYDNIFKDRWIKKWPLYIYALLLIPLIILCVWIILNFPQGIGITLLVSLGFLCLSSSILLFDLYYIWMPLITTLTTIFISYVIIISQLLLDREKNVWQMQKEQEYLKSLEELKTNFVSLISHDLKTPLAKIQSVIHRLKTDPKIDNHVSNELGAIYQESKNLDRYIKSILKLLKIESKDFKITKKPVDVNELVEKACKQLMPVAREKNISISLNLEPMFLIEADETLIFEVVINLIDNSIKYSFDSSIIKIKTFEENNFVNIKVSDNGPGIKKENLDLIFEKFFRTETTTSAQGTGLGLFLVKYFIELHDGSITIESELDKGTDVTVRLPIETEG